MTAKLEWLLAEPDPVTRQHRQFRATAWLQTWTDAGYTRAEILTMLGITWLSDWDWNTPDAEASADTAINAHLGTLEVRPA